MILIQERIEVKEEDGSCPFNKMEISNRLTFLLITRGNVYNKFC